MEEGSPPSTDPLRLYETPRSAYMLSLYGYVLRLRVYLLEGGYR